MSRGFTILEFLVILGVLAVVSVVFVFLINPAELMREVRDRQRIADLGELKKAVALYVASVAKPDLDSRGNCSETYSSISGTSAVDGSGWLPVNFNEIPGGSTIKNLPIDPVNDEVHFYSYTCNEKDSTFNLKAEMESKKYVKAF